MFQSAPTLQTPRLTLRAHRADDFDRLYAMWSDEAVVRFIGRRKASPQDAWFRLMRYLGHWPLLGYGYWAVCDTQTGRYIGDIGIANFMRGLGADFDEAPECGWVLAPEAFGRGYATEAMQAGLDWFEATHGRQRMVCMIETPHEGSIRVARKLGFEAYANTHIGDDPITLFQRP